MRITVTRAPSENDCTIGILTIDNASLCYTLEDVIRPQGEKVYGKTAIPAGEYQVVVTFSPHFGMPLPLLLNVPRFEGVRIHPGNTAADTEGCILVGMGKTETSITHSRQAFAIVFDKIKDALANDQEVWIELKDKP